MLRRFHPSPVVKPGSAAACVRRFGHCSAADTHRSDARRVSGAFVRTNFRRGHRADKICTRVTESNCSEVRQSYADFGGLSWRRVNSAHAAALGLDQKHASELDRAGDRRRPWVM